MDTLQTIASALGLGLAAGVRLYLTVFFAGLGIRFGFLHLNPSLSELEVLAHPVVLIVAGVAAVIEFLADKIPWVDSLWDSFHTVVRPVGAALIGAAALGNLEPATQMIIALLCGGVALTGHSSKAATRLVVNHSPEPLTNIGLSLLEDAMVPAGIWLALEHPFIALAIVCTFVFVFAWVAPRIYRLLLVEWTGIVSVIRRLTRGGPTLRDVPKNGLSELLTRMDSIPTEAYVRHREKLGLTHPPLGVKCAATKSIRGLRASIGYLCYRDNELVFVTRRLFRDRIHRIPLDSITDSAYLCGLMLDQLVIQSAGKEIRFDVFKPSRSRVAASAMSSVTG